MQGFYVPHQILHHTFFFLSTSFTLILLSLLSTSNYHFGYLSFIIYLRNRAKLKITGRFELHVLVNILSTILNAECVLYVAIISPHLKIHKVVCYVWIEGTAVISNEPLTLYLMVFLLEQTILSVHS